MTFEKIIIYKNLTLLWISWVLLYLGINEQVFYAYLVLLLIDFLVWFIKGFVLKKLSSWKAIRGFFRKLSLILLVLAVWVLWKILDYNIWPLLAFIFTGLWLAEIISIIRNVVVINNWDNKSEQSAVSKFLKQLAKVFEKQQDNNLNNISNGKTKK